MYVASYEQHKTTTPTRHSLIHNILNDYNQITKIKIAKSLHNHITLIKDNSDWVVVEKDNFPVEPSQIKKLLWSLQSLTDYEKKTANPKRFSALSLQDLASNDQGNYKITIFKKQNNPILDLIIGTQSQFKQLYTVYLRHADSKQSWKAQSAKTIALDIFDFIDNNIMNIDSQNIQSLTITPNNGKPYRVLPTKSGNSFYLQNVPADKQVKSDYEINTYGQILSHLMFEDVQSQKRLPTKKPSFNMVAATKNMNIFLRFFPDATQKDMFWMSCYAKSSSSHESEGVNKINKKCKGWLFRVPSWVEKHVNTPKSEHIRNKKKNG